MAVFLSSWTVEILAGLTGLAASCLLLFSFLGPKEIWDLDQGGGLLARLKKRRDRLLRSMKDLETERDAGTLAIEEFRSLRNDFKRRAIAASRDLERVRRRRLRALETGRIGLPASQRKRIENLVKTRKETS